VSRWVSLLLLLFLAGLQVKLWVSGGMRDVWRLELAVAHQQTENAVQASRNEQLGAEVSDLKQGAEAVEERARSELGMVKNDEIFYQVIESARPNATTPPQSLTEAITNLTDQMTPQTPDAIGTARQLAVATHISAATSPRN
jgi:cell division protein FtsB